MKSTEKETKTISFKDIILLILLIILATVTTFLWGISINPNFYDKITKKQEIINKKLETFLKTEEKNSFLEKTIILKKYYNNSILTTTETILPYQNKWLKLVNYWLSDINLKSDAVFLEDGILYIDIDKNPSKISIQDLTNLIFTLKKNIRLYNEVKFFYLSFKQININTIHQIYDLYKIWQ